MPGGFGTKPHCRRQFSFGKFRKCKHFRGGPMWASAPTMEWLEIFRFHFIELFRYRAGQGKNDYSPEYVRFIRRHCRPNFNLQSWNDTGRVRAKTITARSTCASSAGIAGQISIYRAVALSSCRGGSLWRRKIQVYIFRKGWYNVMYRFNGKEAMVCGDGF